MVNADGPVVTFYSFKGGVGRTMALANIAAVLARWHYRVLCIDWDLEAPGISHYFAPWLPDRAFRPGLVEWVTAAGEGLKPAWEDFVHEALLPGAQVPISVMTAGCQDASYKRRVQALRWDTVYEEQGFGDFLEQARWEWKSRYDLILLDSRTGITDISGICTIQLPDLIVLLATTNQQSIAGCADAAQQAMARRQHFPRDRCRLLCLPVIARCESQVEQDVKQAWRATFQSAFRDFIEDWAHRDVSVDDLLQHTCLPYTPRWSHGERLVVLEEDGSDSASLSAAFETLAALLARQLGDNRLLVQARDLYVAGAQRQAAVDSQAPRSLDSLQVAQRLGRSRPWTLLEAAWRSARHSFFLIHGDAHQCVVLFVERVCRDMVSPGEPVSLTCNLPLVADGEVADAGASWREQLRGVLARRLGHEAWELEPLLEAATQEQPLLLLVMVGPLGQRALTSRQRDGLLEFVGWHLPRLLSTLETRHVVRMVIAIEHAPGDHDLVTQVRGWLKEAALAAIDVCAVPELRSPDAEAVATFVQELTLPIASKDELQRTIGAFQSQESPVSQLDLAELIIHSQRKRSSQA